MKNSKVTEVSMIVPSPAPGVPTKDDECFVVSFSSSLLFILILSSVRLVLHFEYLFF